MKRTIFRIVPHQRSKGWQVIGDYNRLWATKAAAVAYYASRCRCLWAGGQTAQLVVCRRDGTIQYERTYGADPRRSKG